jgi:hypothetical protein
MATQELNITWDDLRAGVHEICKERGWHHGVPIMSATDTSRQIILAKGCPLSDTRGHDHPVTMDGIPRVHVCTVDDVQEDGPMIVNEWRLPAQRHVVVMHHHGKAKVEYVDRPRARLDMFMDSMMCAAGAVSLEAELRAMCSLFQRINGNQRECYILTGAFPETSDRSHVTYILRKGLPTIALRCEKVEGGEKRHFLAALCSHPLAWYSGTHIGAYPPSDEVLANLLSIRADEHAFWKRAGQHKLGDPEAGI